jgi:type IV pilus assembly protein PilM
LTSAPSLSAQFYQLGIVKRVERWLNALPHPALALEIGPGHVAAARWGSAKGTLETYAIEPLPAGAVMPSPVDANIPQPDAVRAAVRKVLGRVPDRGDPIALLIPDAVVRVFILPFETLPRRADEALPILRWRLKKSVPFDVEETVVSWTRQTGKAGTLEVLTAVARQRNVREYEEAVESQGASIGVVLSSTLASLPLLEDRGATLLVRMSGRTLTTVIVNGGVVCVYRSSEMHGDPSSHEPQAMLDEIFPAIAYYQDTWGASVDRARIAGAGAREGLFHTALAEELKVSVGTLADAPDVTPLGSSAKDLIRQDLDALVGWDLNEGA